MAFFLDRNNCCSLLIYFVVPLYFSFSCSPSVSVLWLSIPFSAPATHYLSLFNSNLLRNGKSLAKKESEREIERKREKIQRTEYRKMETGRERQRERDRETEIEIERKTETERERKKRERERERERES